MSHMIEAFLMVLVHYSPMHACGHMIDAFWYYISVLVPCGHIG